MKRYLVRILPLAVLIIFASTWFAAVLQGGEDRSAVTAPQSRTAQGDPLAGRDGDGEEIFRFPDGTAIRARRKDVLFDELGRPAQIASRIEVAAGG